MVYVYKPELFNDADIRYRLSDIVYSPSPYKEHMTAFDERQRAH